MTDNEKLDLILSKTEKLEKDVTDIKLTLETELRKIKTQLEIAELFYIITSHIDQITYKKI